MENMEEQLHQIHAVIEILKDVRPLCEGPEMAGMLKLALEEAEALRILMVEGGWPRLAESQQSGDPRFSPFSDPFLEGGAAELCFPV